MRPKNFSAQKLAERLDGQSCNEQTALNELYPGMKESDMTKRDKIELASLIFYCEECGNWFDIGEHYASENGSLCERCYTDYEENKDDED